jgi:hypothetical protein
MSANLPSWDTATLRIMLMSGWTPENPDPDPRTPNPSACNDLPSDEEENPRTPRNKEAA